MFILQNEISQFAPKITSQIRFNEYILLFENFHNEIAGYLYNDPHTSNKTELKTLLYAGCKLLAMFFKLCVLKGKFYIQLSVHKFVLQGNTKRFSNNFNQKKRKVAKKLKL